VDSNNDDDDNDGNDNGNREDDGEFVPRVIQQQDVPKRVIGQLEMSSITTNSLLSAA
jgi:hypothetical protein